MLERVQVSILEHCEELVAEVGVYHPEFFILTMHLFVIPEDLFLLNLWHPCGDVGSMNVVFQEYKGN